MLTRDRISGLFMLAFCIAYGVFAYDIELYPGAEEEPFTARTLPLILAWTGGIFALLIIVVPSKDTDPEPLWREGRWGQILGLCVAMAVYGLTIKSVGFLLSTTAFVLVGFLILGERRWRPLVFIPLPIAAGFQLVLHGMLGIYIEDPFLKLIGLVQ